MLPPPVLTAWARKLIASELVDDSTTAQTELATVQVYERLRQQFRAPVGVDAFQALASRALSLTKVQFPMLRGLNIGANGSLLGLGKIETIPNFGKDDEVGIALIAQLLRLFLSLLGEAATVRLIDDASLGVQARGELAARVKDISVTGSSYLGPFKYISLEADQLRQVSERLETLTDNHDGVDELMSVAGNIRNIATVLDVFTLIRSKAGGSEDSVLIPRTNGYLN
jgi:hypothetical protein